MADQETPASSAAGRDLPINEVTLQGRLAVDPEERVLPSGDCVWTFRVVVRRPPEAAKSTATGRRRESVDALDCAAWTPRVQRSVATWSAGDVVSVSGALRRRFFRAGTGSASRVEIEVMRARRVRRRGSAA